MFFKTGLLKSYASFAGKRLCWSLFLKLQARIPFFTEHLQWLLLKGDFVFVRSLFCFGPNKPSGLLDTLSNMESIR